MDMREVFTIDGRRFSSMAGFYDEVERVFTFGLDQKIGRNLNAFNDILRGGFGRHAYGQPIHIQWLAYEKSVRNLGKEDVYKRQALCCCPRQNGIKSSSSGT